ncbi:MAG: PDDEXK nuclease domain-containing protein [Solirubrobacteraceae bacterium]
MEACSTASPEIATCTSGTRPRPPRTAGPSVTSRARSPFGLHGRQGSALTNFAAALEPADADQALQATKDPYIFDFLELAEDAHERDRERALIADIQKFLLELGTGFAFYGRQKPLLVGEQEFFIDCSECRLFRSPCESLV